MARAQVTHSSDAVQVTFRGDKRHPEPSTAVIKFPGGHVEVSRCSDGKSYWAHIVVVDGTNIEESRVGYSYGIPAMSVSVLPQAARIQQLAVRVSNSVPHFDPDA